MKKAVLLSLGFAMVASLAVAGEGRGIRSSFPASIAPALVGQSGDIAVPPALSPTPDPAYAPAGQVPGSVYSPAPYGTAHSPIVSGPSYGAPVEIYQNVKYRATRNIAPDAIPTIIQVPDPCNKDACCKTCVNVQVCAPPCEPCKVRVTRDGSNVRYDYGKYAVNVRSIGKHVVVHYED